jgi:hypothetical protein
MGNQIDELLLEVADAEEHSSRQAALDAAHEVQDEMDALCMQIKQLLAASYAIKIEQPTEGLGR